MLKQTKKAKPKQIGTLSTWTIPVQVVRRVAFDIGFNLSFGAICAAGVIIFAVKILTWLVDLGGKYLW